MLTLPTFQLHSPASVTEALSLLEELGPDAVLVAGGTDLIPNMKRGLLAPRHLVSLKSVRGLSGIREDEDFLHIGAMTPLDQMARDPRVSAEAAALAEAAGSVGGPQHRSMGTLGGNLCLDTRCRYYDQTEFWRNALGYCLKKDGDQCHVVPGAQQCVAAASNDTAAAAIALDAVVDMAGREGARSVPARDFYTADGISNTVRKPGELVIALRVPRRSTRRSAYEKLRRRGAIDFPMLSIAASVDVRDGRVASLELVVSALAARPRRVTKAQELAVGKEPGAVSCVEIARLAKKTCNPLTNIDGQVAWRKEMVEVLVERVLGRVGLGA